MAIDYLERIPNNVSLADNRRLQRALEDWQPKFLEWWRDMGPEGFQARDVPVAQDPSSTEKDEDRIGSEDASAAATNSPLEPDRPAVT